MPAARRQGARGAHPACMGGGGTGTQPGSATEIPTSLKPGSSGAHLFGGRGSLSVAGPALLPTVGPLFLRVADGCVLERC
eukprot:7909645-Alexandrium_andersonii.AAC.1